MDTAFAKIVTDMNGWDSILIEGRVVTLAACSQEANNQMVETIVRGLRCARDESSNLVGTAGAVHAADASTLGVQTPAS